MSVTIRREDTRQAGGCNGCSYPDGERGTVYEIRINNLSVRLCFRCLNELEKGIEWMNRRRDGKDEIR